MTEGQMMKNKDHLWVLWLPAGCDQDYCQAPSGEHTPPAPEYKFRFDNFSYLGQNVFLTCFKQQQEILNDKTFSHILAKLWG